MSRVLVLAGGSPHAHDFAATGAALVDLGSDLGHEVDLVDDPDRAAAMLATGYDALVMNGLWWRMQGEAYDAWRPEHAYVTPESTRIALWDHVARGGGLLALHTTTICFDDWAEWGEVVGGSWRWGVSAHPPLGPVRAVKVADHPVVEPLGDDLELTDEVYGDLDLREGVEVLMTARRDADDADQPVVWAHRYRRGRVVYDGFGHDADSVRHPRHRALLAAALTWILEDR